MKTFKPPVTAAYDSTMKKSTKTLIVGVFLVAVILGGEVLFHSLGMAYGPTQALGCGFAGLCGAFKLIS